MCERHSVVYRNAEDFVEHQSECSSLLKANICLYNVYGGVSCKETFHETASLVLHYFNSHGKYACSQCYGVFESPEELEDHEHNPNLNLRLRE